MVAEFYLFVRLIITFSFYSCCSKVEEYVVSYVCLIPAWHLYLCIFFIKAWEQGWVFRKNA